MIEGQTAFMWQHKDNQEKDLWVAVNSGAYIQLCKSKAYSLNYTCLIYKKNWSSGNADTQFSFSKINQQANKNPSEPTKTCLPAVAQKSLKPKCKCTLKARNIEENNPVFFKFPNFCPKSPLQSQQNIDSSVFLVKYSLRKELCSW